MGWRRGTIVWSMGTGVGGAKSIRLPAKPNSPSSAPWSKRNYCIIVPPSGISFVIMARFIAIVWLCHAVTALVPSAMILALGSKRVHLHWWELSALICPFGVWVMLFLSNQTRGDLGYIIDAVGCISISVPVAALARVIAGARVTEWRCATFLLCVLCLVAAIIAFLPFPAMQDSM